MWTGFVAPGFDAVADAFERNFEELGDIGAGVAVYHRGRLVVDLAAGSDPVRARPFTRESLMMVASCTKGAMATCVLMLVDAGVLDLDEPVATYWPEFGQAGKHTFSCAGSSATGQDYPIRTQKRSCRGSRSSPVRRFSASSNSSRRGGSPAAPSPITPSRPERCSERSCGGSTGQTLGAWFAEHVAGPLGLEFWIGLPAALDDRVVPSVWDGGRDVFAQELATPDTSAPGSYAARRRAAMAKLPPMDPDPHDAASRRAYYGIEVPAGHGVSNARSLARMYAALLDDVDGTRLLSARMLDAARTPQTDGLPALIESGTAGPDIRFGLGFQLASPSMPGLSSASFGHTGAGGRLGVADPGLDIAFGYVCNSTRNIGPRGDPRWSTLLDAVGSCI